MVLYSFAENPSKIRPFASDNLSRLICCFCLLVSECSQKNPGRISVASVILGKEW